MEKVEKTKIRRYEKEKLFKKVVAGILAGLMVLSIAVTLISCLIM